MGEVVIGSFTPDCSPDRVLETAIGETTDAIVIGWAKDGNFYFDSSTAAGDKALWLLELARKRLMETFDDK